VSAAAVLGASVLVWTIVVIALVVLFLLWLYCLFDIVVRRDHGIGWKTVWSLVTIVAAPVAIPVYLLFARHHAAADAAVANGQVRP
jgi:hypothetical protein